MTMVKSTRELYQERLERDRDAIEKRTGKSPEELYEEREKRVRETIQLKEPDRVPVVSGGGYFAARYAGLTASAVYYDITAYREACRQTALDLEPDLYRGGTVGNGAGPALEALDVLTTRWPGYNLPADVPHQFVEGEYMKEDEYDLFLSDPTDFVLRYSLPRMYGALKPLARLPILSSMWGPTFPNITPLFTTPEFQQVAAALYRAGQEQLKWREAMSGFDEEMAQLGFPPVSQGMGGVGASPFDSVSDFLRGMRGSMIDMYRRPEKLLALCDRILEWRIARAVPADPKSKGYPRRVGMPLHRGAESFMSKEQFERFYWPTLKKAITVTVDLGFVPMPFFEGGFGDRLEYLLELPKGKVVCQFDRTDMTKAKAVLSGHLCIMGNVPASLLQVGTPQEVEEYCRDLIKVCGRGGGFILTSGGSTDEAKPENVKAMVGSVKKYGVHG